MDLRRVTFAFAQQKPKQQSQLLPYFLAYSLHPSFQQLVLRARSVVHENVISYTGCREQGTLLSVSKAGNAEGLERGKTGRGGLRVRAKSTECSGSSDFIWKTRICSEIVSLLLMRTSWFYCIRACFSFDLPFFFFPLSSLASTSLWVGSAEFTLLLL